MSLNGLHDWLDRWAPLAEWGVAIGTILLAGATVFLAHRVRQQVKVESEQLTAAYQPLVLPFGYNPDSPFVHIQNAGKGPAINIRGALYWLGTAGGASSFHPVVLAAGANSTALVLGQGIDVNWTNARGFFRYFDLTGAESQTHFEFHGDAYGNIRVETIAFGSTTDFGKPAYNAEEGWTNKPENVYLWRSDS